MKIIDVPSLSRIPSASLDCLYDAMKPRRNAERLAVLHFFHSDRRDGLENRLAAERIIPIFPPSIGRGLLPHKYANFEASVVRTYHDQEVFQGLPSGARLWENCGRGRWRNTRLGNAVAARILLRAGIVVRRAGALVWPEAFLRAPDQRLPTKSECDSARQGFETALARFSSRLSDMCARLAKGGVDALVTAEHLSRPLGFEAPTRDIAEEQAWLLQMAAIVIEPDVQALHAAFCWAATVLDQHEPGTAIDRLRPRIINALESAAGASGTDWGTQCG